MCSSNAVMSEFFFNELKNQNRIETIGRHSVVVSLEKNLCQNGHKIK